MKFKFLITSLTLIFANKLVSIDIPKLPEGFKSNKQQVAFTENKGQIADQFYKPRPDVLFAGSANGMVYHLRNNGISYQLSEVKSWKFVDDVSDKANNNRFNSKEKKQKVPDKITTYRLDINWLNANKDFSVQTNNNILSYDNFYLEQCPNGATNVKTYESVLYKNIYNNINLNYYQKDGALKYDYIVAPGANYKQIQLQVNGAKKIIIQKNGSLLFETELGNIQEGAPVVYQNNKLLKAKWIVKNNILSFDIENYNPKEELIIDPVIRAWGTYYAGSGSSFGQSCTTDGLGNVYLAGITALCGGTEIATIGSHQNSYGGGMYDAFLVQFDASGLRQWGTYYGAIGDEYANSCSTDAAGNIYLTGYTNSTISMVIATVGSHQSSYGGGKDAFLVKFNNLGIRQWGTYYGDSGNDEGFSCATDAMGNVYLAGVTSSTTGTVIASAGSHQSINGGLSDGFLVKFNSVGIRQWGTYYGDSGSDIGYSCSVDAIGYVYLAGETGFVTLSGTLIATAGSHQSVYGGDTKDAFLVQFNSSGIRQWGTYYGSGSADIGTSCTTDATGNVYLAGHTGFTSMTIDTSIATTSSHQTSYGGGFFDAFLVKFDASGLRQWGTYYGGYNNDYGFSCATDITGNVYLSGVTRHGISGTVIATTGSYQNVNGGNEDAYLVKFNTAGLRLWGTYYGGTGNETAYSCISSASESVYIAGNTNSSTGNIIASVGSHQSIFGGGLWSAYIAKFKDCINIYPTAAVNSTLCSGGTISFTVNVMGTVVPTYSWFGPASFTSTLQNPIITGASAINTGDYSLTVNNSGCIETTTVSVIYVDSPTVNVITSSSLICVGTSATLTASGVSTYTWNSGTVGSVFVDVPIVSTTYSVSCTNTVGCTTTETINIVVDNTCADVWPGDANSDGLADNLDVLELGLHYSLTGPNRALTSNLWQSYFSNNWAGTITGGKNLNHSNCNGDGVIDDNDTLAVFNNYNLTHVFKPEQTTTNPVLSIVPDQPFVDKGNWGTASIYLGDATTNITNINGVAFTVNYDNSLIDLNSVWIEYPTSFINAGNQNLKFRKLDFSNNKLYTATTHTITGNVSGYGKIATLHYKIKPTLATDAVLNLSVSQANQSNASGIITPLTTGSASLMAIGASVGINSQFATPNSQIVIFPNPTNGSLTITSQTILQKIELIAVTGQTLYSQTPANTSTTLNLENLASGIYFINLYQDNRIVKREKVMVNR